MHILYRLAIDENLDVESFESAVNQFLSNADDSVLSTDAVLLIRDVITALKKQVGEESGSKSSCSSEQGDETFEPKLEGLPVALVIKIAGFLDTDEDWTPFCATCKYLCFCVNIHIQYIALVMRLVKFLILGKVDVSDDLIPDDEDNQNTQETSK